MLSSKDKDKAKYKDKAKAKEKRQAETSGKSFFCHLPLSTWPLTQNQITNIVNVNEQKSC